MRLVKGLSIFWLLIIVLLISGCGGSKSTQQESQKSVEPEPLPKVPVFSGDSAYQRVAEQVAFGPRVPNSKAHQACRDWLVSYFQKVGLTTVRQDFSELNYKGERMQLTNIVASYNPKADKRILLAAHWDTRHISDQDKEVKNQPIDGANDGGSGVAVLMEIARLLAIDKPQGFGVDILLLDGEDQGEPDDANVSSNQDKIWWCLGSQYWSANKHIPNYGAYYGILLDMVGGKNARFFIEGGSMRFAPTIVEKVWTTAARLGYNRFVNQGVEEIIDDHVFIANKAGIPIIDIIEYENSDGTFFSPTWHTRGDNMTNIDKQTLQEVGQTVLTTLYLP